MTAAVLLSVFLVSSASPAASTDSAKRDGVPRIEFRASKTLGLWNFMESISRSEGTLKSSEALREIFERSRFNTPQRRKLLEEFHDIQDHYFRYGFHFSDYPEARDETNWNVSASFDLQSAKSGDLDDFYGRTGQTLPPSEHRRMFSIVRSFVPVYEELIWKPSAAKLNRHLKALKRAVERSNIQGIFFGKAIKFYHGTWPGNESITVYLCPVPKGEMQYATIIDDSVLDQAFLGAKGADRAFRDLSDDFHEICHGIYESESVEFQRDMDQWFKSAEPSPYGAYAYRVINETLATAIGNGLVYRLLTGADRKDPWYYDETGEINAFARGLYPMVLDYWNNGRPLDKDFVIRSVEKYKELFPNAEFAYSQLLSGAILMTDSVVMKSDEAATVFEDVFGLHVSRRGSPIADEDTLADFRSAPQGLAFMLIVSDKGIGQLDALKGILPEMLNWKKRFPASGSWVFSALGVGRRPVLIFKAGSPAEFKELLTKLKEDKFIQPDGKLVKL